MASEPDPNDVWNFTTEPANGAPCICGQLAALTAQRDVLKAAHDSLIGELATILGAGKVPSGVGREEYWIGRVGTALAEREAERDEAIRERDAARADDEAAMDAVCQTEAERDEARGQVATLLEAIETYSRDAKEVGLHRHILDVLDQAASKIRERTTDA